MLDLSKNLGIAENLIFYGDHEDDRLVYYLPDEIGFSKTKNGDEEDFELFLQLFKDGQSIEGGLEELQKNSGGILSLGIECKVTEERLSAALEALTDENNLPDNIRAAIPSWERGKVDLMVLDSITDDEESIDEDSFVKNIIGSKSPSLLTGDLRSIFNVRLDSRGAAIVASSLAGDRSHIAGVLYDLKFKGIQPALDLRIWADLERCYKTISHKLGIKAEFTYYVKFSLGADFEHITREMEENGDLKIEVLSQVADPEMKKLVDETIKDTKEKVLRELFRPMVNPGVEGSVPISLGLEEAIPKVGVAYEFKHIEGVQSRIIDLDFRERSATIRTHNPQAHLWMLGHQIDHKMDQYTKMVNFSDLWRMHELEISLVHDFSDELNDLLAAEILVWRHKDGVSKELSEMSGVFNKPSSAKTLASFTFTQNDKESKTISWTTDKNEPEGYYYQVRFLFDSQNEKIDTPDQIVTEPVLGFSQDLPIILNGMTLSRRVRVLKGNIDFNDIKSVNVSLYLQNPEDEVLDRKLFIFNQEDEEIDWWFRRKESENVFLTEQKEFHFKENLPSVKSTKRFLPDDEIIINRPFRQGGRTIIPVLAGSRENIQKIILTLSYLPEGIDDKIQKTIMADSPEFLLENIQIPGISPDTLVEYQAKAITIDGKVKDIDDGVIEEQTIIINLKKLNSNEIVLKWVGDSPEDQDLRFLKIEFAHQEGDEFDVFKEKRYQGEQIPDDESMVISDENIVYQITKLFMNGEFTKTGWKNIEGQDILLK
jgi:hypothetical protein